MLKEISKESKALILLEFTKEILMHSRYGEMAELKEIIKEESKEQKKKLPPKKEEIKELIKEEQKIEKEFHIKGINNKIAEEIEIKPKIISPLKIRPRILNVPEPKIPTELQYLKPTAGSIEIDLGKLNPFLADPVVRKIECEGPGQNIVVMVPMPKYTTIILDKEEIEEIIKSFEAKSKIPASEGIYNVVVGKIIFSAIISDVLGSKFSIKKMDYVPIFR